MMATKMRRHRSLGNTSPPAAGSATRRGSTCSRGASGRSAPGDECSMGRSTNWLLLLLLPLALARFFLFLPLPLVGSHLRGGRSAARRTDRAHDLSRIVHTAAFDRLLKVAPSSSSSSPPSLSSPLSSLRRRNSQQSIMLGRIFEQRFSSWLWEAAVPVVASLPSSAGRRFRPPGI